MKSNTEPVRMFLSLTSYAKLSHVLAVLKAKTEQLDHCFVICHDKDETDSHCHIVMKLKKVRKASQIRAWFQKCLDCKDEIANTFSEYTHNCDGMVSYLTHKNQKEKHQYNESDIIVLAGSITDYVALQTEEEEARYKADTKASEHLALREAMADDIETMLDDIVNKVSHREMARRYGRDFIKNYRSYRDYALMVCVEETGELPDHLVCDPLQNLINKKCREASEYGVDRTVSALSALYSRAMQECGLTEALQNQIGKKIEKYIKGD